jgi:hypothetical protein
MSDHDALVARCVARGVPAASALEAVLLAGCRSADDVLSVLRLATLRRWAVLYSATHCGRPYYYESNEGRTSWEEPAELRLVAGRIDCATFSISAAEAAAVAAALSRLMAAAGSGWPAARDTAAKLLSNVLRSPTEHRYRRLNGDNDKLRAALLRHSGSAELLHSTGWRATVDGGGWELGAEAALNCARCALARLAEAQRLTQDGAAAGGTPSVSYNALDDPAELAAMTRYQLRGVFRCASCERLINDGSERAWTGRWDAPSGQYRYACECGLSLCEACFDAKRPARAACCGVAGQQHDWAPVAPITSRLQASGAGGSSDTNPWGRFGGAVSSRSRERLKDRTGM